MWKFRIRTYRHDNGHVDVCAHTYADGEVGTFRTDTVIMTYTPRDVATRSDVECMEQHVRQFCISMNMEEVA